jgi:UDP-3-O-[3-hydroxymyristoyl] glucosamine N-acyltransferase
MPDLRFFSAKTEMALKDVLELTQSRLLADGLEATISGCAPLSLAGPNDVSFFSDRRYSESLKSTRAGYVFVTHDKAKDLPDQAKALIVSSPQAAWSRLCCVFYRLLRHEGTAHIHKTAHLEAGVDLSIGVVIGQGAYIGAGTRLEPYSVIGPGCTLGRGSHIGAHASVFCTLAGDRVSVFSGARIGEAGFGVSGDERGLMDVPQLGRVILQDDVTIGANSCVDRGAYGDTVIGEGTKIDNLVQIAHNVQLGRGCIIAAHSGLSGSVKVGDGAMFGGRTGILDHVSVGDKARIGASSAVFRDIPAGELWSGYPAKASRQFLREVAWLGKQAIKKDQS